MEQTLLIEKQKEIDDINERRPSKRRPHRPSVRDNITMVSPHGGQYSPVDREEIPKTQGFYDHVLTLRYKKEIDRDIFDAQVESIFQKPEDLSGGYSSWGSSIMDLSDLKSIKNYFGDLLQEKKRILRVPYVDLSQTELDWDIVEDIVYDVRYTPSENFFVSLPNELIHKFDEIGFDFEKWYDEYRSLPENKANREDIENAIKISELEKEGDNIKTMLSNISKIKPHIENIHNLSKDVPLDSNMFTSSGLKELNNIYFNKLRELKEISKDIVKIKESLNNTLPNVPFEMDIKRYGRTKII